MTVEDVITLAVIIIGSGVVAWKFEASLYYRATGRRDSIWPCGKARSGAADASGKGPHE